jgi:hypothetical protein
MKRYMRQLISSNLHVLSRLGIYAESELMETKYFSPNKYGLKFQGIKIIMVISVLGLG